MVAGDLEMAITLWFPRGGPLPEMIFQKERSDDLQWEAKIKKSLFVIERYIL